MKTTIVISFVSRKGGVGKTTTSVNTAKEFRRSGKDTALIITDRNTAVSALTSVKTFSPKQPIKAEHATKENALSMIKSFIGYCDIIIVDGGAEMPPEILQGIAEISNLVIIPTSLSELDIDATRLTLADIVPALQKNPFLRVALLPSMIHWLMLQDNVKRELEPLKTPVLRFIKNWADLKQISTYPETIYRELTHRLNTILYDDAFIFRPSPEIMQQETIAEKRHIIVCHCGCGESFHSLRSDARYVNKTHQKRHERKLKAVTIR